MHKINPSLNSAQTQAVKHNKGPLLIVAGAGTGKTTTLVEKIKYLIKNKLATPEEILCLTFTEKAAYEMEERVDMAMPYGFFQMWISTFHKFADEVLKNDIYHLGLSPGYKIMTQSQAVIFLKKHIFDINLDYFRPISNPNKFIEGLLQHFSTLHNEDVTPEDYEKYVNSQCANEDFQEEEIKQKKELAYTFKTYQKLKRDKDMMDFDDLIYYTLKLFRKRKSILKKYQKKFKYVLVDEFQDTNIAQYELIKLLCPPEKNPNLTVVGDDSQAIYKFRGASISNIMTFMSDYKDTKLISLLENYRSNQSILDHAYKLIQNNNPDTLEHKLGISKELISKKNNSDDKDKSVFFESFSEGEAEANWISKKILDLKKRKKYNFQDFSVLVRANNHSEPIVNSLKVEGIPFQFLGPGTLFKQKEVKDLISYLSFLSDLGDDVALYRVLTSEIINIDAEDISILLSFSKDTPLSFYQSIKAFLSANNPDFFDVQFDIYKDKLPIVKEKSQEKFLEFMKMVKDHIENMSSDSAGEILFDFIEKTGYIKKLGNPKNQYDEKITLNVTKFFQKLKNLETELEDRHVHAAVEYIQMSLEMGESPLASDTDAFLSDAVNILTVHSSKGLEFPVVFLPSLTKNRFPTRKRTEQIPVPEEILKEQAPDGDYHTQEERRLFYVALTRSKDLTYLTFSDIYGGGVRRQKVSPFVYETIGEKEVESISAKKSEHEDQISIFDFKKKESKEAIKIPNKLQKLSFSQISTYDFCPLKYKYQYILKIPTTAAAGSSFGSSIHNALYKFYKSYIENPDIGLNELINMLHSSWIPYGYKSKAQEKKMKEQAKEILENYFHSYHSKEIEIIDLEKLFKIRINSDVYMTGRLDRVDKKANKEIEIIDYKTGKMPDEKKIKKSMQLSLYAMAANDPGLYNKPLEKINLSFYYLGERKKFTFKVDEKEIEKVEKKVDKVIDGIRNEKFKGNVGKWCKYCNFFMICDAQDRN